MLPTKFRFIWQSGFRGEYFLESSNQKQELSVVAIFDGSGRNEQSQQRTFHRCFLPSFGSFGKTVSEEKNLKYQPIRNKNCLWWPCLLMDRDGMSNLYRGPSIDAPMSCSDPAIYILTGIIPIEAQIHIKALTFFNNVCHQGERKKTLRKSLQEDN